MVVEEGEEEEEKEEEEKEEEEEFMIILITQSRVKRVETGNDAAYKYCVYQHLPIGRRQKANLMTRVRS